jgi:hypothetical protein
MNDAELDDRDPRHSQAYRNLVTVVVFAVIIGTLGGLYFLALGGATGQGVLGALCTVGFLAVAFLGWEYLMKPGYGLHARVHPSETDVAESVPEEPRSPGTP